MGLTHTVLQSHRALVVYCWDDGGYLALGSGKWTSMGTVYSKMNAR